VKDYDRASGRSRAILGRQKVPSNDFKSYPIAATVRKSLDLGGLT